MALTLDGDNGISGINGSATTPAVQGTDTNTGLTFGTNTVGVVTDGSTRATVDSGGQFLIGTTTNGGSNRYLTVGDTSLASNYVEIRTSTSGDGGLTFSDSAGGTRGLIGYSHGTDALDFWANGGLKARTTNTGLTSLTTTAGCIDVGTTQGAGTSYWLYTGRYSATAGTPFTGTVSVIIYSNGNIQNTNGSYTQLSDAKLKENIVDAGSQWDDIKAIRIRNWNFKEETGYETHRQIGPVAQELETVCPGLVFETPDKEQIQVPVLDENGNAVFDANGEQVFNTETRDLDTTTKGVHQSVLYMKAVKALQEAMERIEQLETRVAQLEGGAA